MHTTSTIRGHTANERFYGEVHISEVHILDVNTQNYYSVFTNQLYEIQQIQWK